jgi:site-specific DNA-methyltransferase (adenine-specific)
MDDIQLFHGDCLEVMRQIPDGSVDMVLADPPYGTTACKWDSVIPFEPMWEQLKRIIKPNGAIVMTASQPFTTTLISSNMKEFKYCWVWDKGQGTGFLNSKKQPLKSCEDVVVFYQKQSIYNPQMRIGFKPYSCKQGKTKTKNYGHQTGAVTISEGERFPLNNIKFIRDKSRIHPTQKPVALMEYLIKTYTNECETVLDFTMGSGTTGVACVNTGRKFIGIELDDKYFNIAKNRINETTTNRP